MLRFLLFVVVGYFILRIIQIVVRAMASPRGSYQHTPPPPEKSAQEFKDVQDAEFEELPPENKK